MLTTDPIADMITRIRNANMVHKDELLIPHSKMKLAIARILEREGYVKAVEEKKDNKQTWIHVSLKYVKGEPVIRGLRRISTPGRRVYNGYQHIPVSTPELGMAIVSTSQGIMTSREARKKKIGGEILCEIY
ncbi:MAG: 30S ribosomal protein S8 [Patescibacteria group bacterium]|jgi:small subunit ribosomal protein S8